MSFKDADFDEDSPFAPLQRHGFFPYSGADGDLFRKHGLAGWRVSVYGRHSICIQRKSEWRKNKWLHVREWRTEYGGQLPQEDIDEFDEALEKLVETGELDSDE